MENSVLEFVGVLDLPLMASQLLRTSNNIFCGLLKYKIVSLEFDIYSKKIA